MAKFITQLQNKYIFITIMMIWWHQCIVLNFACQQISERDMTYIMKSNRLNNIS